MCLYRNGEKLDWNEIGQTARAQKPNSRSEDGMTQAQRKLLPRVEYHAKRAGRYASLPELLTQAYMNDLKLFGWVGEHLYEVWPGGRNIQWR